MGRLKKAIVALLVIVLLAATIVAVRVQLETRKKTRDAKFDHFIYARNFACVLSSCTRKGSEYEYTLEKTPNTDAVIDIMDSLMEELQSVNPKIYYATMERIKEL